MLPPNLPYRLLVQGGAFAAIPSSLRHTITLSLANSSTDVLFTHTLSLPELGHQRLALNYRRLEQRRSERATGARRAGK